MRESSVSDNFLIKRMANLFLYLESIKLPNAEISLKGEISEAFLQKNIKHFWSAVAYVHRLPYARTSDRANYKQVLIEQRGACSVKHALIAALAEELKIDMQLMLGIFLLTAENMPAIKAILTRYKLTAIPEAHTYLKYGMHTLDITFPESTEYCFNFALENELHIEPSQIGEFKIQRHQDFIRHWAGYKANLSFNQVWNAREEWIAQLSK